MIQFELTTDIEPAATRLADALRDGMQLVIARIATQVAAHAKSHHGYKRRTGNLENNTKPGRVEGTFLNDTLVGEVVGATPYALLIESKAHLAFLAPAWAALQSSSERELESVLGTVLREAGW